MVLRINTIANCKILLACSTALTLAACESSGSYRVASVGSVPAGSADGSDTAGTEVAGTGNASGSSGTAGAGSDTGGGTGTITDGTARNRALGARILVTAGNSVIGVAGKQDRLATLVDGKAPALTPVTGKVTAVLTRSGQTLVDLGQGRSLILAGKGRLGELVRIDLASKTVVGAGAGSSLIGAGVLSPTPATGRLAAINLGNGAAPVTLGGRSGGAAAVVTPVTRAAGGIVRTPGAGGTGLVAGVTGATQSGAAGRGTLGLLRKK